MANNLQVRKSVDRRAKYSEFGTRGTSNLCPCSVQGHLGHLLDTENIYSGRIVKIIPSFMSVSNAKGSSSSSQNLHAQVTCIHDCL